MRKFHQLSDDDPVWTANRRSTVGSMARALADSKTALAETRNLEDRVDDVDALIDDALKSFEATKAALVKRLDAFEATKVAKLDAKPDATNMLEALAKRLDAFEVAFHKRQHAAEVAKGHTSVDFETYMESIEADRESIRKRDAFDDGVDETNPARFNAMYRIVK